LPRYQQISRSVDQQYRQAMVKACGLTIMPMAKKIEFFCEKL